MAKKIKAHLQEESKLWSFEVLCQKQIMNARRESKERNLTWRIQEDSNCWRHFEYFLKSISCILYVVSKIGKSEAQRFKRYMNWSWKEEVMAIWRQPHKVERKFHGPKPISYLRNKLRNETHLRNFVRCFAAAKPPPSTRVPLRKLKLHLRNCEPRCEITSKLRNKLQIISKLRNHLQVAKSQIQLAKSKFKLAKWTIQSVKSTCAISDICNRLS